MPDLLEADQVPSSDDLIAQAGYMTKQQTARSILISTRTLDRLHETRTGPPRTRIGKKIFYRKSSLIEWLVSREEDTRPTRRRRR